MCVCAYVRMCVRVCVCAYLPICLFAYLRMCVCVCVRMCVCVYVCMHGCMYACTSVRTWKIVEKDNKIAEVEERLKSLEILTWKIDDIELLGSL